MKSVDPCSTKTDSPSARRSSAGSGIGLGGLDPNRALVVGRSGHNCLDHCVAIIGAPLASLPLGLGAQVVHIPGGPRRHQRVEYLIHQLVQCRWGCRRSASVRGALDIRDDVGRVQQSACLVLPGRDHLFQRAAALLLRSFGQRGLLVQLATDRGRGLMAMRLAIVGGQSPVLLLNPLPPFRERFDENGRHADNLANSAPALGSV